MLMPNLNFITWLLNRDYWRRLRWLVDNLSASELNQNWDENSFFFFNQHSSLAVKWYFYNWGAMFPDLWNQNFQWVNADQLWECVADGWSSSLIGQDLDWSSAPPHKALPCESHPSLLQKLTSRPKCALLYIPEVPDCPCVEAPEGHSRQKELKKQKHTSDFIRFHQLNLNLFIVKGKIKTARM